MDAVSCGADDLNDALRPVALLRREYELDQRIISQSSHLEEVRRMILCGLSIGPLSVHVVEKDVKEGQLWRLPPYKTTSSRYLSGDKPEKTPQSRRSLDY